MPASELPPLTLFCGGAFVWKSCIRIWVTQLLERAAFWGRGFCREHSLRSEPRYKDAGTVRSTETEGHCAKAAVVRKEHWYVSLHPIPLYATTTSNNKQQAPHLLSVLAITPFPFLGCTLL